MLTQKCQHFPGASPPGPLDGAGLASLGPGGPVTIFELPPCLAGNWIRKPFQISVGILNNLAVPLKVKGPCSSGGKSTVETDNEVLRMR